MDWERWLGFCEHTSNGSCFVYDLVRRRRVLGFVLFDGKLSIIKCAFLPTAVFPLQIIVVV